MTWAALWTTTATRRRAPASVVRASAASSVTSEHLLRFHLRRMLLVSQKHLPMRRVWLDLKCLRSFRPISTHYFPTLYQHKYELEDGRTVRGGPVRYGYDDNIFPGYSWRGYCVLSHIQVSECYRSTFYWYYRNTSTLCMGFPAFIVCSISIEGCIIASSLNSESTACQIAMHVTAA